MSDEAILALFTDVEDFGKYDTPTQAKNEDGSPKFNAEGKPVMEKNRYNLTAFAEGAKPAIVEGGFMTIGGWQGARLGAAAYASRVPQTGVRPLDVGGKAVAATLGAVVGSGILMKPAEYINEWLFEEPDPIVVPSLQAAYNAGETTAYGISFLATPWVGTKLAGPKLSATFNATKTLENFKTIASSKYKPDELVKKFGQELVDKANKASQKQASKGPIAKALTTDATLGPVGARISTAITTGGAAALEVARNNPKSFIGVESLMSVFGGLSAYGAEKLAPGNEGVRFGMELISAPIALKTIPPITNTAKKTYNVVKKVFEGGVTDANGVGSTRLESEARKRINEELRNSPEFLESPDSEADMLEAIDALLNFKGEDGTLPSEILNRPVFGKNKDAPSPLASKFLDIEDQLSTRQDDIAVATVKGKERFLAQAKMNIMKLRESRSPEAFQLAAHVEQRVFEQEMIDEIKNLAEINKIQNNPDYIKKDITRAEVDGDFLPEVITESEAKSIAYSEAIEFNPYLQNNMVQLFEKYNSFEWQEAALIPSFIDRKFKQIYDQRNYFYLFQSSANTTFDYDVDLNSTIKMLGYIPRALQVAYLAPFPSTFFEDRTKSFRAFKAKIMKNVVHIEMLFIYVSLLGLVFAIYLWRRKVEFWVMISFSLFFTVFPIYAYPNIGALVRYRYAGIMLITAICLCALVSVYLNYKNKKL